MSTRRNARSRGIRGPQSALTDFLASNNISAAQIRADYEARQAAAEQGQQGSAADDDQDQQGEDQEGEDDDAEEEVTVTTAAQQRKRKRQAEAAKEKIKKSRAFKKRKTSMEGEPGEDDDDGLALDMYEKAKPVPGQLENCDICEKRFTVTPYSKEGPNGGLLCTKCSKEMKDQEKKDAKKAKKPAPQRRGRRQAQSALLDGLIRHGSKGLVDLCVEKIANVSNDIDEFGDIGDNPKLITKLSQIFSKRRVLTSRTSKLFLRSDYNHITLHDCGNLETEDFIYIFSVASNVKHLNLRNAGQMKDEVIDYILDKNIRLESLQLGAANLISDAKWCDFFEKAGSSLKELKLSWLDFAFTDDTVAAMAKHCPNLKRLKIKRCFKVTEESLGSIAQLKQLEHLSLYTMHPVSGDSINHLISEVGPGLRTLSLERFDTVSNDTLEIIHNKCTKLKKLRISDNDYAHDAGWEMLFTGWANPALEFIDLTSARDLEEPSSDDTTNEPIGLGDKGFRALMKHSGLKLKTIRIPSCRHIPRQTMGDVFDGKKVYPSLEEVDFSLIPDVDDIVVRGIFKSCPKMKKVTVFACFGVKDVVVPKGVALIGTPHAQEAIVQEGTSLG